MKHTYVCDYCDRCFDTEEECLEHEKKHEAAKKQLAEKQAHFESIKSKIADLLDDCNDFEKKYKVDPLAMRMSELSDVSKELEKTIDDILGDKATDDKAKKEKCSCDKEDTCSCDDDSNDDNDVKSYSFSFRSNGDKVPTVTMKVNGKPVELTDRDKRMIEEIWDDTYKPHRFKLHPVRDSLDDLLDDVLDKLI